MTEYYEYSRDSRETQRINRREAMMDALKDAHREGHAGLVLSELARIVGTTSANISKIRNQHAGLFAAAVIDTAEPNGASNTFVSGHPDLVRHWSAA